jgi:hypothetical protein
MSCSSCRKQQKSTSKHAMRASAVHQTSSMKAMMAFARVRSNLSITSVPQRSKSRVRCCLPSVHSRYKLAFVSLSLLLHTLLISYEKTDLDPSCASSFSPPAKSEDLRWNVCLSLFSNRVHPPFMSGARKNTMTNFFNDSSCDACACLFLC